jgi:diguanylate cyclase (GGDEF)-like protein
VTTGVSSLLGKARLRSWRIAGTPPLLRAYLISVDLAAVAVVALVVQRTPLDLRDARLAGFLVVLSIAFEEGVRRAAQLKLRLSADLKRDMTSVWTVATAVALPAGYAAAVIGILGSYIWFRQHRPTGHAPYLGVFNVAANVLAVIGAASVVQNWHAAWSGLPWALSTAVSVLVAMVAYTIVNRALPTVALIISRVPMRELRGTREDNLIELATLCLGGLVAIAALHEPWLCVLVVAPMVTLQRGALVAELETAATVDAKTGLLNAVAWEHLAQRELARGEREKYDVAVLIIDIDRFKLVNDRYGHLIGDRVLQHVGKVLSAGVREYDTVGRFGGEEFVAVLPNAGDADALVVAERLRSRVNELRIAGLLEAPAPEGALEHALAISIGVASTRFDGREVSELLVAADAALYKAKATGRNRVILAERGSGSSFAPQN